MNTRTCDNCGTPCGPDDAFCENCGYDFITGSLPDDDATLAPASPASPGVAVAGSEPAPGRAAASGSPRPGPDDPAAGAGGPDETTGATGAPGLDGADEAEGPDAAVSLPAAPSLLDPVVESDVARLRVTVSVDRAYFDEVVSDGEIDFPEPVPSDAELELAGPELHIGRTSESRAIHPDIDVADLTGDQAVSSRHAVIRLDPAGACTITDVGSTNGTFIGAIDSPAIEPGVAVEVGPGTPIFLGAWTRITIDG